MTIALRGLREAPTAPPPDDFGRQLEAASIRGLVQILCDGRLVTILAILLRVIMSGGGSGVVLVVLAVPLSWLPLRYWTRSPWLFHRSPLFAVADALVAVIVIAVCVATAAAWELGVVYLLLSAALSGALARRGTAVLVTAVTTAVTALLLAVVSVDPIWTAFIALCALGTAYASASLSRQLRQQGVLARKILSAREAEAAQEERASLAREMHDSLAKTLRGVELMIGVVSEDLEAERSPHAAMAQRAHAACATASTEARSVLAGLRAAPEQNLAQAVRLETRRWSDRTGIAATADIDHAAEAAAVAPEVSYQLLKVLGELLENVARHARAGRVEVAVGVEGGEIVLRVADDGVGMGSTSAQALALGGHYGVLGMQERLRLVDGRLDYETSGRGTRAIVRAPWTDDERSDT